MWGLCLLTFSSLVPYVIVRYFIGGVDVLRNLSMAATVVLFSATVAAGAIGASSFSGIAGRIGILLLFAGSLLVSMGTVLGVAAGIIYGNRYGVFWEAAIWNLNALAVVFCYTVFGLALARSRLRLVVQHYEVKPSWMVMALLIFTPFVVMMAALITLGHAGGIGLVGMGLVGGLADVSPKAPRGVAVPAVNVPPLPGGGTEEASGARGQGATPSSREP